MFVKEFAKVLSAGRTIRASIPQLGLEQHPRAATRAPLGLENARMIAADLSQVGSFLCGPPFGSTMPECGRK